MKEILKLIQVRLGEQVETLKYIDLNWGQMDYYTQAPLKFPAALVHFRESRFENEGKHTQRGIAQIDINVYDMALSNSNAKAPDTQRDKAFEIFDLLAAIHAALHGWAPPGQGEYGNLTRTSLRFVKRDDGVRAYTMSYVLQYVDNSALIQYTSTPTPSISLSVGLNPLQ